MTSEPSGARVIIDGAERGQTPLTLPFEPGAHTVVVSDGRVNTTRTVEVTAGGTVSVVAALTPVGPAAGWLTIASPLEMQVFEAGTLLGTSANQKIMLPAGKHELELVNDATELRMPVTVDIQAGKTSKPSLTLPMGTISINAVPWANVWLDGKELGTTPVANQTVTIGAHEVIWRHPQFGERTQRVVVGTKMPMRVVMDFNR